MGVDYPVGCDTAGERQAWCDRAKEKLRLVHNGMDKWYRLGLTQVQYDLFPNKVKNRYAYKANLTEAEFRDFEGKVYHRYLTVVMAAKGVATENAKQDDVTYNPDLDEDVS